MASTTRVRDLFYRVSDQLTDLDPQFDRWDQKTFVMAANDGQRVIAKFLPSSCSRLDAFKLAPGTLQSIAAVPSARLLSLDGSPVADRQGNRLIGPPRRNLGADGETPGRVIRAVDQTSMDAVDPDWHTKTGTVVRQVVYDPQLPKFFSVWPGPGPSDNVWVELAWLPDPLELDPDLDYAADSSEEATLSIDDKNVDDLMNYILARCHLRDSEFSESLSVASTYTQLFVSSINTQAVAAGLPNPKLRSLPMPAQQAEG